MLLLKAPRGYEKPGHKYLRRWRSSRDGRWRYDYAEDILLPEILAAPGCWRLYYEVPVHGTEGVVIGKKGIVITTNLGSDEEDHRGIEPGQMTVTEAIWLRGDSGHKRVTAHEWRTETESLQDLPNILADLQRHGFREKPRKRRYYTPAEAAAKWPVSLAAVAQERRKKARRARVEQRRHMPVERLVEDTPEFQVTVTYESWVTGGKNVLLTHSALPRMGEAAVEGKTPDVNPPSPIFSPDYFTVRQYNGKGQLILWETLPNFRAHAVVPGLSQQSFREIERSMIDNAEVYAAWVRAEQSRQLQAAANADDRRAHGQDPLMAAVEGWEETVRDYDHEIAAVFRKDGSIFDQRGGTPDQVMWPPDVAMSALSVPKQLKPAVLTHAHPVNIGLSPNDLLVLADWELDEIRCVHNGYVYRMTAPKEGWRQKHPEGGTTKTAWAEAVNRIMDEEADDILHVRFNPPVSHLEMADIWLRRAAERIAAEFGCIYERRAVS